MDMDAQNGYGYTKWEKKYHEKTEEKDLGIVTQKNLSLEKHTNKTFGHIFRI